MTIDSVPLKLSFPKDLFFGNHHHKSANDDGAGLFAFVQPQHEKAAIDNRSCVYSLDGRRVYLLACRAVRGAMTRAREEQIIAAAYKEAKARGLPDGWTCTIDVSSSSSTVLYVASLMPWCRCFARFHDCSSYLGQTHALCIYHTMAIIRNANGANGRRPTMANRAIPFPRPWPFRSVWGCCRQTR